MKVYKFGLLAGVAMVVLTACGGGGGSSNAGEGTDYTSKYVGTWKSGCHHHGTVLDATTGLSVYFTRTLVMTRTNNTSIKAVSTDQYFASADTSCQQTSLGSLSFTGSGDGSFSSGTSGVTSGAGVTITVDGQTTANGKAVDKITIIQDSLTSLNNATITAGTGNRFRLNSSDFSAVTVKDLAYASATNLTLGDHTGVASNQYPTTLSASPFYTKQ